MDNFQGIPREISYNSATSLSVEENQQDKDQTKGNAITDEQLKYSYVTEATLFRQKCSD